ncbi:tyrosine-type recombinase/integrase [Brucella sp. TWI559]
MPKLTKTMIDNAEIREKPYFLWCSELPGFGVRVFNTGKKSFYVDYYNQAGQRKRMSLGGFGKLTVDDARKMARINLSDALRGDDPALERKTRRTSLTVTELCQNYFELAEKGLIIGRRGQPKKKASVDTDRSMVSAHVLPLLGTRLVADLKRADIVKFIRDVSAGKTAKAKAKSGKLRGRVQVSGGAGSATRTVAALGAILTYAVSEGIIEINPTHGVKKPAIGKRDRRLNPDEYAAFGKALKEAEGDETKAWQGVMSLRLAAYTGCRIGEIEKLRWSEVDFENSVLKLEDTKTGKSVRPLGSPGVELLKGLERDPQNEYVFPAKRLENRPYAGLKRFYRALFEASGFDDVTPHVLRHSFASVGADLGFSDSTIGAMLGHTGGGITSRYTHRLDSVLVAAADKIAQEVEKQMAGKAPAK